MYISYSVYPFLCWQTRVRSTPWLSGIMLPWTWMCKYRFKTPISILWVYTQFIALGSYDNSIFNFWRNHSAVFHSSYIILHSHQQGTRVPVSAHPHPHLLLGNNNCFSSSLPLVYNGVSHCSFEFQFPIDYWCWTSFMCPSAIYASSLEKGLFRSLAHFLIGLFCYCCWMDFIF